MAQPEQAVQKASGPNVAPNDVPRELNVAQEAARTRHRNNLKQLAVAMRDYHEAFGTFPPAAVYAPGSRHPHSWRVALLPFLDHNDLYQQYHFDEPWDSPHNRQLLAKMPAEFAAPDPDGGPAAPSDGLTRYQVLVGPGAVFEVPEPGKDRAQGVRMTQITDGTSNTILIAEGPPVFWTKPQDLAFDPDPKAPLPPLGGLFPGGFYVVMADGRVVWVREVVPAEAVRAAITRAGGETASLD
jgi:hypothetical protein